MFFFSIKNVSKNIGKQEILRDISLDIQKGDIWSILGPSGSGKTTLLRILAGFDKPTSGRVILNGKDITRLSPQNRPINTVFQSYALFPHMSVSENVRFGLRFDNISKKDQDIMILEALELLEMQGYSRRYPHELSGGQQQRVAIARCLVKKPLLLLMDEPFASLDRVLKEKLQESLFALLKKIEITCINITHDQTEALGFSTHIAILGNKTIQQSGVSEDMYNNAKNTYVARFLGYINIFSAVVKNHFEKYTELSNETDAAFYKTKLLTDPIGANVCFGVRSERIVIHRKKPKVIYNTFKATIMTVNFRGREILYTLFISQNMPFIRAITPYNEEAFKQEEEVWISWSIDAAKPLQL